MFRILNSEQDALALTEQIEAIEGIPRPGTTSWGASIKHPVDSRWAVILSDLSTSEVGDLAVLPADWYPAEIP